MATSSTGPRPNARFGTPWEWIAAGVLAAVAFFLPVLNVAPDPTIGMAVLGAVTLLAAIAAYRSRPAGRPPGAALRAQWPAVVVLVIAGLLAAIVAYASTGQLGVALQAYAIVLALGCFAVAVWLALRPSAGT